MIARIKSRLPTTSLFLWKDNLYSLHAAKVCFLPFLLLDKEDPPDMYQNNKLLQVSLDIFSLRGLFVNHEFHFEAKMNDSEMSSGPKFKKRVYSKDLV